MSGMIDAKTGRFREPPRIQELENPSVFLWSFYCRLIVPAFSQQVLSDVRVCISRANSSENLQYIEMM
jgi:hypothetical protein